MSNVTSECAIRLVTSNRDLILITEMPAQHYSSMRSLVCLMLGLITGCCWLLVSVSSICISKGLEVRTLLHVSHYIYMVYDQVQINIYNN